MNRHITRTLAALTALAAASGLFSCGRDEGRPLSDYKDLSTGDSLLYYYGQLRAAEYWQTSATDTVMRNPETREAFLRGLERGVESVRDGKAPTDRAYNDGLRMGLRMGRNLIQFEQLYGVDLDPDVLIASYRNALAERTDIPRLKYQQEFYRLLDAMRRKREASDLDASRRVLVEEARELGMAKRTDDLYYIMRKPGTGPEAKTGDMLEVAIDYRSANGESIGVPSPAIVTVGTEGMPLVMLEIYRMMREGGVGEFATTASALFGTRSEFMALKPTDVVILTVTLRDIISNPTGMRGEDPAGVGDDQKHLL